MITLSAGVEGFENRAEVWTFVRTFPIKPPQANIAFMAQEASGACFCVRIALSQLHKCDGIDVETLHHFSQAYGLPFHGAM
jgi:hypothetical protein